MPPSTFCTGTHACMPSSEQPGSAAAVLKASPWYLAAKISCGINAACLSQAWRGLRNPGLNVQVSEREQFHYTERAKLPSKLVGPEVLQQP